MQTKWIAILVLTAAATLPARAQDEMEDGGSDLQRHAFSFAIGGSQLDNYDYTTSVCYIGFGCDIDRQEAKAVRPSIYATAFSSTATGS